MLLRKKTSVRGTPILNNKNAILTEGEELMKKESTSETIKNLWKEMEHDLEQKDPHDDWPLKAIVMTSPWSLAVHALPDADDEHETQMQFVLQDAVRKEDFDESSLPADLLEIIKKDGYDATYPNVVEAYVSGATLEEAIAKMRQKLRLLDPGYILMDWHYYSNNILDEENGSWMLDDEEDDEDDWFSDDDEDEN